jgi:hypothetical protein
MVCVVRKGKRWERTSYITVLLEITMLSQPAALLTPKNPNLKTLEASYLQLMQKAQRFD